MKPVHATRLHQPIIRHVYTARLRALFHITKYEMTLKSETKRSYSVRGQGAELLTQIQHCSSPKPSRVLDEGPGTGLVVQYRRTEHFFAYIEGNKETKTIRVTGHYSQVNGVRHAGMTSVTVNGISGALSMVDEVSMRLADRRYCWPRTVTIRRTFLFRHGRVRQIFGCLFSSSISTTKDIQPWFRFYVLLQIQITGQGSLILSSKHISKTCVF
jgi:hypothetical protein